MSLQSLDLLQATLRIMIGRSAEVAKTVGRRQLDVVAIQEFVTETKD